jgi:3-carboxy-cis,cis-muconate cycloisomerase
LDIYGALHGTPEMQTVFSTQRRVAAMVTVEAALARAQGRLAVIPAAAAGKIDAALAKAKIDIATITAATENTGYPIVSLVKELGKLAGHEAAAYIHWGATTQDILDTALVLTMRTGIALLERDLVAIIEALAKRARTHRDDVMAGRTHLQHALPVTFGYKCAIWLDPLIDALARLQSAHERAMVVQFGGAVGTLASLGTRGREVTMGLASELGLRAPDAPWHADRSALAEVASAIALACGSLAKMATDVVLLMQTEVAEVFEPHAPGRGASSTMPQKRNPIACEYVLACTRGVHALVPVMFTAMAGDHERSTGPWQSEDLALPNIFIYASAVFAQSRAIASGMTVDTARMRRNLNLTGGLIMSEAVATALSATLGKSEAHHIVETACARAINKNQRLIDVLAEDAAVNTHFDRIQLEAMLDPGAYTGECGAVVDRVLARAGTIAPPISAS